MRNLIHAAAVALLVAPLFAYAQDKEFISLTNFGGLSELGNSAELYVFFNNLYKFTIGIAATLAVFQIIIAGISYMGGDSFTEKKAAKEKITMAILGLVLVLSPILVFSIINPNILNLKLNLDGLQTSFSSREPVELNDLGQVSNDQNNVGSGADAPNPTAPGCDGVIPASSIIDDNNQKQVTCCSSQTSDYAVCSVERASRKDENGQWTNSVAYCGCSIRPNLGMTYYEYYSAPTYQGIPGKIRYETDLKLVGIAPASDQTKFTAFESGCKAADGKFEAKSTRNILQSKYIECPANIGVPANTAETSYRCRPMQATCTNKN